MLRAVSPVFSKTLLLECTVAGKVSLVRANDVGSEIPPDGVLDPATLRIEIDERGSAFTIAIDGPSDYQLVPTSVSSVQNEVKAASISEDSYVLQTARTFPTFTLDGGAIINRRTGAISVLKTYIGPTEDKFVKQVSYDGTCNKINKNLKF